MEFIRPMRGASQPHLLRCDDDENYVVKFENNPQHAWVLANEMLASRLAQRVGLPVPRLPDIPIRPLAEVDAYAESVRRELVM